MIINERHCITRYAGSGHSLAAKVIITLTDTLINSLIFSGEIEYHRPRIGTVPRTIVVARGTAVVQEVRQRANTAFPKLYDRHIRIRHIVIFIEIRWRKTLAHIPTPRVIAYLVLEPQQISLNILTHISIGMIEVPSTIPSTIHTVDRIYTRVARIAITRGTTPIITAIDLIIVADMFSRELEVAIITEIIRVEIAP